MPKFLCLRTCWDDSLSPGSHRMFSEGKVYVFPKEVKPPRHFQLVKTDEDGNITMVGQPEPNKKASKVAAAKEKAAAEKVAKEVASKSTGAGFFEGAGA